MSQFLVNCYFCSCSLPHSSFSPSLSWYLSCKIKCLPQPAPSNLLILILYLEYKRSTKAFDLPHRVKFLYLLITLLPSLKLNLSDFFITFYIHSMTLWWWWGRVWPSEGRRKLPPSQRVDCLATTNQPNIFGRVSQPIERVRAGFSTLFLLVAWRI